MCNEDFELEAIKNMDALLLQNDYEDDAIQSLLPYFKAYLGASKKLRALPLGNVRSYSIMVAGGER